MADVVAAGDLAYGLTQLVAATERLALLVVGQFRFAAKPNAARLRPLPAFGEGLTAAPRGALGIAAGTVLGTKPPAAPVAERDTERGSGGPPPPS
jgi:hypothetical protein